MQFLQHIALLREILTDSNSDLEAQKLKTKIQKIQSI
jgi:hypothetical protein